MSFLSKILKSKAKSVEKSTTLRDYQQTSITRFIGFNKFSFPFENLKHYYRAYQTIPQLRAIIDTSAIFFTRSNDKIVKLNNDGSEEIDKNNYLNNLLLNPHPFYGWNQFKTLLYKHWKLFNRVHVLKGIPFGRDNVLSMFILPTIETFMIPKDGLDFDDIAYARNINDIIKEYVVEYDGQAYHFAPEDIFTISDGSLNLYQNYENHNYGKGNLLYPDEKLKGLKEPLKIIAVSYDTEMELKNNYGAMGILSPSARDGMGSPINLLPDDIEKIQKDYESYGLSKDRWKLMLTTKSLDFQPITLPISSLELPDGIKNHKRTICDAFNFPILKLNELEGSTFSNMDVVDRTLYTDKIIPEAMIFENALNNSLGLNGTDNRFRSDFSHIEVLQKDAVRQANANKITTETIIRLNEAVSDGKMSYEVAINTLSRIMKITYNDASDYISKPIQNETEV